MQFASSYSGREIICRRSKPRKKIQQLTLNAFITASSISNRSRESDVFYQNVIFSTQSLSDFEIVRPAENEQDGSSGSFHSTQVGHYFQPNWRKSFLWIEYNASRDVITCEVCSRAIKNNKTSSAAKLALERKS